MRRWLVCARVSVALADWTASDKARCSDDSAARVTQKDTWRMRGEGDVAKCDYANFLDFRAKTSKIHNFRIRALFLTFFICIRS